jgi:Outer membrane protein beta-barrel domain
MKKQFLLLMIVFVSAFTYGQKGSWYVGGVAGYGSNTWNPASGEKSTSNTWAFGPEVGTFLQNDIQLGFILGLDGSTAKMGSEKISETSNFAPTIYARKFKKITDNFSLFSGLYLGYVSGTGKGFMPEVKTTSSGVSISLGVGMALALSPRWTAVGQYGLMGYTSTTQKIDDSKNGTESDFKFGVNTVGSSNFVQGNGSGAVFNIGLYYTFSK